MSDELLDRARAALEGTTPEPWVVNYEGWAVISHKSDSVLHPYVETTCVECDAEIVQSMGCKVALSIEDLEFMVAARSLVPELVAEVEKLRGAIESVQKLRGAIETIREMVATDLPVGHPWAGNRHDILAVIERTEQP